MGKAAGRVVQSLVFLHTAAPLTASATPSPGLSFDYESEHLEHQRSPTAQGLSKSKMWLNSGRVLDSLKPNLPRRLGTAAKDLGTGLCSNKTQDTSTLFPNTYQHKPASLGAKMSSSRCRDAWTPHFIAARR